MGWVELRNELAWILEHEYLVKSLASTNLLLLVESSEAHLARRHYELSGLNLFDKVNHIGDSS